MTIDPRLRTAWERFLGLLPLFALLSVVAVWVLSGVLLADLPGPIPTHFDAGGKVNGFGPWWLIGVIATAVFLVMLGVMQLTRWLSRTHPEWMNMPAKAAFMRLSVDARMRIAPRLGQLVLGFSLILNLGMLALVRDTYRIALREVPTLPVWKLVVLLGLTLVWIVVGVIRLRNAILKEAAAIPAA